MTLDFEVSLQTALLPLLQVSNHAEPRAVTRSLEHQLIVGWCGRLHEEHLDECARLLAEVHACLDHLGVVEHHHGTLRQIFRKMIEHIVAHLAVLVDQQFAVVALGDREFGNAFIG